MNSNLSPVVMALLATLFTWGVTALGATTVFMFRTINQKLLDSMLGFAAGVMIAASYWSLLEPSISMATERGLPPWLPALVGFIAGGIFLRICDMIIPHLHPGLGREDAEGIHTNWKNSVLLVLAITLHNIPEGLAVGVAFGSLAIDPSGFAGAMALALGIGLQNFPEGMAVSVPLRREGLGLFKSFMWGQLSGVVEIIAGVAGALAVGFFTNILPYALSFAAGAMIYVTVEELIPEAHQNKHGDLATMGLMLGFAVMMTMDVAFG